MSITQSCLSDMELGHILRPSDLGIQRPGDPVDPMTLFYKELQMSTYVADKRLQLARGLPVFITVWRLQSKILKIIYKMSIFQWRLDKVSQKYISLYLYLGIFFSKTWKTEVSHRVKMMTRWPGRERWPKWPIDPVPCLMFAPYLSAVLVNYNLN